MILTGRDASVKSGAPPLRDRRAPTARAAVHRPTRAPGVPSAALPRRGADPVVPAQAGGTHPPEQTVGDSTGDSQSKTFYVYIQFAKCLEDADESLRVEWCPGPYPCALGRTVHTARRPSSSQVSVLAFDMHTYGHASVYGTRSVHVALAGAEVGMLLIVYS
jgi:hypothetical protein